MFSLLTAGVIQNICIISFDIANYQYMLFSKVENNARLWLEGFHLNCIVDSQNFPIYSTYGSCQE